MIDFLSQIENLLLSMTILLKTPGFFCDFCSEFQIFFLIFKIPGFLD